MLLNMSLIFTFYKFCRNEFWIHHLFYPLIENPNGKIL